MMMMKNRRYRLPTPETEDAASRADDRRLDDIAKQLEEAQQERLEQSRLEEWLDEQERFRERLLGQR